MGKANRQRRSAKLKDRERERRRRAASAHAGNGAGSRAPYSSGWPNDGPGHWQPTPAETAAQLVSEAVHAQFHDQQDVLAGCVEMLTDMPGVPGWQQTAGRALFTSLTQAVTAAWRLGWQPAEVVRQVGRQFGARHVRLATDAVAGEMRGYAAATIDERWADQLASLGANLWWDSDDAYLDCWREREQIDRGAAISCALQTLYAFATLTELAQLCRLPGTARRGSLTAEPDPRKPVDQRMLHRVRALLAKAESTEFPDEAAALTSRAQELMARHSIDDALLAAAGERTGRFGNGQASARRLFVDSPYEVAKASLLDVIATANRCRAIWHKDLGLGTVLGFPADLDAVELLFTSLLVQATTAMVAAGSKQDAWGRSRTRAFRQSFLASYAHRIGERLAEATGAAERQAAAESTGTNLLPVLAARHRAVDDAVDAMFPELTSHSAGSITDREGWITGRTAADLATLHGRREVTGDAA